MAEGWSEYVTKTMIVCSHADVHFGKIRNKYINFKDAGHTIAVHPNYGTAKTLHSRDETSETVWRMAITNYLLYKIAMFIALDECVQTPDWVTGITVRQPNTEPVRNEWHTGTAHRQAVFNSHLG